MADKPANAGGGGGLAGDLALPPAVHHSDYPRPVLGYRPAPAPLAYGAGPAAAAPPLRPEAAHSRPYAPPLRPEARGHRHRTTSRARTRTATRPEATEPTAPTSLSWLPYLLVLAGVATGLAVAWNASRDALAGTVVIAGTLLFAALARLVLPSRYAGPLCTRSRTYDVLALTVLGGSVLAIALTLP
jgi:Protein of unknown function (DUF3017)